MKIKLPFLTIAFILLFSIHGCGNGNNDSDSARSVVLAAKSVSAGDFHACSVATDDTVKCWGLNNAGQLGNNSATDSARPVAVSGLSGVTQVSAGGEHTCALLSNGTVQCWGDNAFGQLGNGTTTGSKTPVAVSGITNATAVAAGGNHTCASLSDRSVRCWGASALGQLGNGTQNRSSTPVAVANLTGVTAISAGGNHTCTVLNTGGVRCWGANSLGQLGNASRINQTEPVAVSGVAIATDIAAGANHTCVRLSNGGAQCWGDDSTGQLGAPWTLISGISPVAITFSATPVNVTSISTASAIAAGFSHSCAILADSSAKCWGENVNGQLGNGTVVGFTPPGGGAPSTSTYIPVLVSNLSSATHIDAGLFHTCARISGNRVRCWGSNSSGQLGDGTFLDSSTPVDVIN
ncbi:MAG: hypothetical protein HYS21_09965 [Deltaproteobacteria bacterium]|nr:hypothetical protein [Deltaproteobacteria bacterium]